MTKTRKNSKKRNNSKTRNNIKTRKNINKKIRSNTSKICFNTFEGKRLLIDIKALKNIHKTMKNKS